MRKTSLRPLVRGRQSARRLELLAALLRTANTLLAKAGPARSLLGGETERWHVDYQEYLAASTHAYPRRGSKTDSRANAKTLATPVPRRYGAGTSASGPKAT